ncbi:TPA: tail protein X [Yersinia enterocolitica]|nr:tail protein X [Yersinia enterocolitica]HEN3606235.1 tail protein X [Yersinia enterocolitica]HEN3610171.1 tail protein X [Yersinia enterocolitica]HEN3613260.1 tail protein X [Yersinia enterocolitica]HEN3642284.1 tail protein X [Yersinia enterocolitica]
MRIITAQGDTLDVLCFRHYGRTEGVVERVLAANLGLAELGVILPHGTGIALPAINTAPQRESVNLWD